VFLLHKAVKAVIGFTFYVRKENNIHNPGTRLPKRHTSSFPIHAPPEQIKGRRSHLRKGCLKKMAAPDKEELREPLVATISTCRFVGDCDRLEGAFLLTPDINGK